jgi:hypothetical protein
MYKRYTCEGNVIRVQQEDFSENEYLMKKYIEYCRPDLSIKDKQVLYNSVFAMVGAFEPTTELSQKLVKACNGSISNVYTLNSWSNNQVENVSVASMYLPPDIPFIEMREIKETLRDFGDIPSAKTVLSLISAIITWLFGGIDSLIWIMVFSGILYALVGNVPKDKEYDNVFAATLKRVQFFIFPFFVLAGLNLIIYACTLGDFLKIDHIILIRSFSITFIIIANIVGMLKKLEQYGYNIPLPILSIINSIDEGLRTGISTMLTNLQNTVKK